MYYIHSDGDYEVLRSLINMYYMYIAFILRVITSHWVK